MVVGGDFRLEGRRAYFSPINASRFALILLWESFVFRLTRVCAGSGRCHGWWCGWGGAVRRKPLIVTVPLPDLSTCLSTG